MVVFLEGKLGLLLSVVGKVIGMPMQPVRCIWCFLVCVGSHFLHRKYNW